MSSIRNHISKLIRTAFSRRGLIRVAKKHNKILLPIFFGLTGSLIFLLQQYWITTKITQEVMIVGAFLLFFSSISALIIHVYDTSWPILALFLLSVIFIITMKLIPLPDDTSKLDLIGHARLVVTFIGVSLAMLALAFGNKIKELFDMDKKIDEISRLTVSNAELALSHLPDFAASHQIPQMSYDVIKSIDKIVFHDDSYVLKYLDKIGNGSTLRFAKAINVFAEGDYPRAAKVFNELLDNVQTKTEFYNKTLYSVVFRSKAVQLAAF